MSSPQDPDERQKDILIQHLRNPKKGGIIKLSYLHVRSIPYFPTGGVIHLELTSLKNITSLPVLPRYLQTLNITGLSNLTKLPEIPDTVFNLIVVDTPLKELPKLPEWLRLLTLIGTQLTALDNLPPRLTNLCCAQNRHLSCIGRLPVSLLDLNCSACPLTNLLPLPPSLIELICEETQMQALPCLPSTLESLCASDCQLEELPPLPPGLHKLQVRNNPLRSIPRLPEMISELYCEHTLLSRFPHMIGDYVDRLACDTAFFNDIYELPPYMNLLEVYDYEKNTAVISKAYTDLHEFIADWNAEKFKQRCMERCLKIKEELIAEVWKPSRVSALIEQGGWTVLDSA